MRRQACPEGQTHIFAPEVMAQLFAHPEPTAPLPPLPFKRNEEVDVARACKILATNPTTISRMLNANPPLLLRYRLNDDESKRPTYRIKYSSLIDHCDRLRVIYRIPPRAAAGEGKRIPDDKILPFPAGETIGIDEVAQHLEVTANTASKLIDSGKLTAYKLIPIRRNPWRVHRPSLVKYLEDLRAQAAPKPFAHTSPR